MKPSNNNLRASLRGSYISYSNEPDYTKENDIINELK